MLGWEAEDGCDARATHETPEIVARRRDRIDRMVRVAQAYRGWNAGELSGALGREKNRLLPTSGNPKLDLVARLAAALDWEVGLVAESVWDAAPDPEVDAYAGRRFDELDARAQSLHRASLFDEMAAVARAMRRIAKSPQQRAVAANRLAGAFDGAGRFSRVLDCVREGLAERAIGFDLRTMLTVNLCGAYYALWNLDESHALAQSLVARMEAIHCDTRIRRVARAFAYALRGQSARRLLAGLADGDDVRALARTAKTDLERAIDEYRALHGEFDDAQYLSLANTAEGALFEVRAAAGEIPVPEALQAVLARIEQAVDVEQADDPALLESWGWWSVYGANIALRASMAVGGAPIGARVGRGALGLGEQRAPYERSIAIFTNKASEIAEHLDLWPMRERAFTLEWLRRQTVVGDAPSDTASWMLDEEDIRTLVGTMGRFPMFREIGWQILETATLADRA